MINKKELEEKYNIIYIEGQRYYRYSLLETLYNLENSVPYELRLKNFSIKTSSWKDLLIEIGTRCLNENKYDLEELYKLEINKPIFTRNKDYVNSLQINENLYFNLTFQTTIIGRVIVKLLNYFNYDLKDSLLIINKHGIAENEEVRSIIIRDKINELRRFFVDDKKCSVESFEKFYERLINIDNTFDRLMPSYKSIFLIDSTLTFSSLKSKFKELLYKNKVSQSTIDGSINLLDKYYVFLKEYIKRNC